MGQTKVTVDITVADLEIMTGAANYRRWMLGKIASFLGRRIFEIGAGIGNYTEFLLDRDLVVCLEPHEGAFNQLRTRFAHHTNVVAYQGDVSDPRVIDIAKHECDTAVCLNVLEHVCDEAAALSNIRDILTPGGKLVLVVPAIPLLFGTVDRSLGHYRRYTPTTVRAALQAAGFRVDRIYYMNFVGIFGWLWNNRIVKRTEESKSQILFFDRYIVPWLSTLEQLAAPPVGLSLVCVGET